MKLSPEDIRKIHAEINQLVNQRLYLTTFGITIYGAISAWVIPKDSIRLDLLFGSYCLLVILLSLVFSVNVSLRRTIRVLTKSCLINS